MPSAARREASVSRHASCVCSSSSATHHANESIGQSKRKYANYVPPNYAMRLCLRILLIRTTVKFASYQCRRNSSRVPRFHPRQYRPFQFMTLREQMRSWQIMVRSTSIHVVERASVQVAYTLSLNLETRSAHIAIPTTAKQTKRCLKN